MNRWFELTEISTKRFVEWLGIFKGKFYDWRKRYVRATQHKGKIPRDFWIGDWEPKAIEEYQQKHILEGYRRLSFMMITSLTIGTQCAGTGVSSRA
ncbi:MAG: hypothetical protein JKY56_03780 [Kofleriaceae bacterium]|nr:hypothetical protein [Kofleriaceae bacterium]